MKHQYVGDINDYRKYALLRALAAGGLNRIGICWMLTPSVENSDGNKLGYLQQPEKHRRHDPELFDLLAGAADTPDWRRLDTIEQSGAIAGAIYYNAELTDNATQRRGFMEGCTAALVDTELVFFDPDNGLEVSMPKGRKGSSKYLYLDEAAVFYAAGKSLLIYQHFPRIERTAFVAGCVTRLRAVAPGASIWTFTTSNVLFLLVVHPNSPKRIASAVVYACERWGSGFITGQFLGNEPPPHN